jgi:hypothetical protein
MRKLGAGFGLTYLTPGGQNGVASAMASADAAEEVMYTFVRKACAHSWAARTTDLTNISGSGRLRPSTQPRQFYASDCRHRVAGVARGGYSYSSALATGLPLLEAGCPPATRTIPLGSNVAV